MTVAELKAKLANLPEDMEVLVAAASGDGRLTCTS